MSHKKKDPDEPRPLNFDHALEKGVSDHLKKPFLSESDLRGDAEDDQYYDEEEAISPEEVRERKEEENI